MKPAFKNSVAVFSPSGFLDGENATLIVEPQDISYLCSKSCKAALVSLKKIVFFNKRGIGTVIELLTKIQDKTDAVIGFCDYDKKKYTTILEMYKKDDINFSLFETEEVASLFTATPMYENPQNQKIVVYNEDMEHKHHLAVELIERGYEPHVAKDKKDFADRIIESDFIVSDSYLGSLEKQVQAHIKDNVIVYSLPNFVDSKLSEKFDMTYHTNTLKVGFHCFLFDASNVSSFNIHGITFLSKLSQAGAQHGVSIAICGISTHNISEKLKQDIQSAGILQFESMRDFFSQNEKLHLGGGVILGREPRHVTKSLVSTLPLIAQTAMHTVEVMTKLELKKQNVKVQELSINRQGPMLASAIAFYGSISGFLLIIFDKDIAEKSCKILVGKKEKKEESELLDALGELVNIIGGKLINEMQKKQHKLEITMPRTYETLDDVLITQKGTKGVQADFLVDNKPLTIFLTK